MNLLKRYLFVNITNNWVFRCEKTMPQFCAKYCTSPSLQTLEDFMQFWKVKFENSNITEADISIELIAAHVMNIRQMEELKKCYSMELTEHQQIKINHCCECRLARMPTQYIIKEWDFRNVTLKMIPPVFIPRPETESLIDVVTENTKNLNTAMEIGSGSGAISIALLDEIKHLKMTAIDQSKLACDLTLTNAKINNVNDRLKIYHRKVQENGHIEDFVSNSFDVIVSNPPYLFSMELFDLEPEVKLYEDLRALDGGIDGLRVIKAILKFSSAALSPGKSCFMEVHHNHIPLIQEWLNNNLYLNLQLSGTFKDLFGYDRFVHVSKI